MIHLTEKKALCLAAAVVGGVLFLRKKRYSTPCDSGRLIRTFGWWSNRRNGDRFHTGIDFKAPIGSEVKSAAAGTVTFTKAKPSGNGYGRYVVIEHGDGSVSRYCHLKSVSVQAGQQVGRGQIIGLSGSSGHTRNRPQLHFEIRDAAGEPVNPLQVLRW